MLSLQPKPRRVGHPDRLSRSRALPTRNLAVRDAAFVALAILLATSCRRSDNRVPGSGVAETVTRDVQPFTEVALRGAGTLNLTVGPPPPLSITGDDNLLPLLETKVTDGRLTIQPTVPIDPEVSLTFTIVTPELTRIIAEGAADVVVEGVANEALSVDLRGAARIRLAGRTGSLTIDSQGAGKIDALELRAKAVTIALAGAAAADVHATEHLDVTINGLGRVTYRGDPQIKKQIHGLGSLEKRE